MSTGSFHEDYGPRPASAAPSPRGFGVTIAVALAVLAGGLGHVSLAVPAGGLLLVALAAPGVLALPARGWGLLGQALHRVTSPVLLAVLFFAVLTPFALVARLLGKDPLRLRKRDTATYWIPRERPLDPESMRFPF